MKNNFILESEINRFKQLLRYSRDLKTGLIESTDKPYGYDILNLHKDAVIKEWNKKTLVESKIIKNNTLINEQNETPIDYTKLTVNDLVEKVREKYKGVLDSFEIWEPMLEWWSNHQKDTNTRTSLLTLLGEQDTKDKHYDNNIVKQEALLKKIESTYTPMTAGDAKKVQLENLYKLIKSFHDQKVTLKGKNNYLDAISLFLDSINKKTDANIKKEITNLSSNYKSYGTGQFSLLTTNTDAEGNTTTNYDELKRILQGLTVKVNKEMAYRLKKKLRLKTPTIEGVIKKADTLYVKPGAEKIRSSSFEQPKKNEPPITTVDYDTFEWQYPPEDLDDEQRNKLSKNMMPDDGIKVGAEAATSIRNEVKNMVAMILKDKQETQNLVEYKITFIGVNAYSSTSCVRTSYKAGFFDRANNVQLANDRAANILSFGEKVWKEASNKLEGIKGYDVVTKLVPTTNPNIGPEWEKMGGNFLDGREVTIQDYGPLYQEAYKKNKRITPQEFYGPKKSSTIGKQFFNKKTGKWDIKSNPQYDSNIAKEYESVYSRFRHSAFMIEISVEKTVKETALTADTETIYVAEYQDNFSSTIAWKRFEFDWPDPPPGKPKRKKGRRRRRGGSRTPKYNTLGCPKW
jgi:hypothetical protein